MEEAIRQIKLGNYLMVDLEIGFGKGAFLLSQALLNTDCFYIGIEIQTKFFNIAISNIPGGLKNLFLINGDATLLIKTIGASIKISTVHVYYPSPFASGNYRSDPIITESFFYNLHSVLMVGGVIRMVTDDYENYLKAKKILKSYNYWFQEWQHFLGIPFGLLINSFCEKKHSSEGKQFYIYAQKARDTL